MSSSTSIQIAFAIGVTIISAIILSKLEPLPQSDDRKSHMPAADIADIFKGAAALHIGTYDRGSRSSSDDGQEEEQQTESKVDECLEEGEPALDFNDEKAVAAKIEEEREDAAMHNFFAM